ncbi:MAG: repressor LexA [Desulfobulbaceae bacterium]|nr:repressor LexA [Desulfobulbaceae bacterium]
MNIELTDRQRSVLDYIRFYQEEYGISPAIREICAHLGLKSPAGVHKILQKLIEIGILISQPGKKRSWILASGPARKSIPLFGHIAAGQPIEAIGNLEEELPLDPRLFGCDSCFALRVKGDSMIDFHIIDGDLAIIHPGKSLHSGQIGAVMVEGILPEATLKVFRRKKGKIELHSANQAYAPLIFKGEERVRIQIIGKFAGVIRRA